MAASNQEIWAASVLNMDAKEFSQKWHREYNGYVAPGVTTEAGSREENLLKSRYSTVPCIDQTRVILKNRPRDNDFIHANWLGPAAPGGIKYICAQGPLPETLADFWHMIYSEGVSVITMLSARRRYDYGIELCSQYFPQRVGESVVAGAYTVTCKMMLDGPPVEQCIYRQFAISRRGGGETLEVAHAHATYWMDWGAPCETAPTLALHRWVHEQHGGRPVVVHGSAGVGRSLTFCAIDTALARIAADPTMDFFKLTMELREIRAHAFESYINVLYLIYLALDALVDDKKIAPYTSSDFVTGFRAHAQRRNARFRARDIQERNAQSAEAA